MPQRPIHNNQGVRHEKFLIKTLVSVLTILSLVFLATGNANADSQCYPGYGDCDTIANYYHTVQNYTGSYWATGVRSNTQNPTMDMDDIGYSYWTYRQRCNGIISQQTQYEGDVFHYTSSYWASASPSKVYCDGPYTRLGESLGNHDFLTVHLLIFIHIHMKMAGYHKG